MNRPLVLCAVLFFGSAAGGLLRNIKVAGPAASPMASPAEAPAAWMAAVPGPAPAIETVQCEFVIENLDYEQVGDNDAARDGIRQSIIDLINPAVEGAISGVPAAAPAAAATAPAPGAPAAFFEVQAKPKVFSKKAHHSTISHSTDHEKTAAGAHGGAPAASPSAAPGPNNVGTFVALEEGPKDSVEANVWAVCPHDKLPTVEAAMEKVCNPTSISNALLGAEGVVWKHAPIIGGVHIGVATVERFMLDCAPHIKKILSRFSVAYTRAQVPHAIEQACHLFESKVSFSGNNRITKWDKRECKKATEKLMNEWQPKITLHGAKFRNGDWGANSTGGKGEMNYDGWCKGICEHKMGKGAPHCKI